MNPDIFIPERFRQAVALHIIKNLMTQNSSSVPLIMGIHGKSGDGKTFQCEKVIEEIGAKTFLISGGQLESHDAGEPAYLIRNAYRSAGECIQKGEAKSAVVIINDIDTGLGSWGEMVQYTVNRQTVFGELMHLVDYPESVDGRKVKRIPIILTGNDFTKLYEPLVRAGRMTSFEWTPTLEEKIQIVAKIFPEVSIKESSQLVNKFPNQPVSFFSHLRTSLMDFDLWEKVKKIGLAEVTNRISKGIEPIINPEVNLESLVNAGQLLLKSGRLINHLGKK